MAFELEVNESVEAGVRRIVDEQLENALTELRAADAKTADKAVHSARKRFKRIRALVRLVRPELGEEVFAQENAAFRDAGGALSQARDAAVLVQTLDSLKADVEPDAFAAERRKLVSRRRSVKNRVLQLDNGLEAVAKAAEEARARVNHWQIERDGWDAIREGLKKVYADGRDAFSSAEIGAQPELFHEWRKRVKDLWHQIEILEAIWPETLKSMAQHFHALADILGNEHDLAVLQAVLEAQALAQAAAASVVLPIVQAKRLKLQEESQFLGARLFAERPGAFVRRLGKYWCAWKREAAMETKQEEAVELKVADIDIMQMDSPAGVLPAEEPRSPNSGA